MTDAPPVPTAALAVHATTDLDGRGLDVAFDVAPGEVLAVVGPNGAGKSSALALAVGLRRASGGAVRVRGQVVDGDRQWVPPEQRGLGWCPQAPGLLPRATVHRQVAAFARQDRAPLLEGGGVDGLLERLGVAHLAGRRPEGLSGGEAQRVAVARALAASDVVLLDEPTSAQDPDGAAAVRGAIAAHRDAGGAAVVVSHRARDAWLLADRAAVLEDLATVQVGTPDELGAAPATTWVAQVVGVTVVRGEVGEDHVLRSEVGELVVPDHVAPGPAVATLRPEAVTIHRTVPAGSSARNVVRGTIVSMERTPAGVRVRLDAAPPLVATLTVDAVRELSLRPGLAVWATWKASEVHVHRR